MEKSALLRHADVRGVVNLIGECRDLGDDGVLWRKHFCSRVAALVGADFVFAGEISNIRAGQMTVRGQVDWGLDTGFNRTIWDEAVEAFVANPRYQPVFVAAIAGLVAAEEPAPISRVLGDSNWHQSYFYQGIYANVGLDANLYSLVPLQQGTDDDAMLIAARAAGRGAFTARETAIVGAIQSAVADNVGGPLARFGEPSPSALPPRPRQVLKCLLEGDSDKQVSRRLGLSPYTVNQYAKVIYRHFGVSSRPELLARWIRRGWGAAARWAEPS